MIASMSATSATHRHGTPGERRKKIAGTAATRNRSAESSSGGKWSSPTSMTTKFTPHTMAIPSASSR